MSWRRWLSIDERFSRLASVPAIVGVGNRDRGDDAVGCVAVDLLAGFGEAALFDAGVAPENTIQSLVRLGPRHILFVDACMLGMQAGEFRIVERVELDSLAGNLTSTHALPLTMTIAMLEMELGPVSISLLAVQPACLDLGGSLSQPVTAALPRVVESCRRWALLSGRGVTQ